METTEFFFVRRRPRRTPFSSSLLLLFEKSLASLALRSSSDEKREFSLRRKRRRGSATPAVAHRSFRPSSESRSFSSHKNVVKGVQASRRVDVFLEEDVLRRPTKSASSNSRFRPSLRAKGVVIIFRCLR